MAKPEIPEANYREGPCAFCPNKVERTDREAYEEITSFVERPLMHGAVLREYTGRLAHKECVEKQRDGIAADQQSLI